MRNPIIKLLNSHYMFETNMKEYFSFLQKNSVLRYFKLFLTWLIILDSNIIICLLKQLSGLVNILSVH